MSPSPITVVLAEDRTMVRGTLAALLELEPDIRVLGQAATVVDDAGTAITEVVRGRDLLRSTARQLLLIRALNLPPVSYFHTALLLDEHGQRLAKRHDALSLRALRAAGVTLAEISARMQILLHHTAEEFSP